MTIHHDKLAYGRLKSLNEEMSADDIARLVEELNEQEDEESRENTETENNETGSTETGNDGAESEKRSEENK